MKSATDLHVPRALALYELSVSDGEFVATSSLTPTPFNASRYSGFKYGRRDFAEEYGAAMAVVLQEAFSSDEPLVVTGTPYKRVPNAARVLAITAERYLRLAGWQSTYSSIYQHRLAEGDYGQLPAAARDERNRDKQRSLDRADFAHKHVVLVDDVRITGSIERSTVALLADIPVLSITVFNLVRLDPELAQRQPDLEDRLNHASINSLQGLYWQMVMSDEQYTLTTRALKYILQSPEDEVQLLVERLGFVWALQLYDASVDEGYDQMPRYQAGFAVIRDFCHDKIQSFHAPDKKAAG